ncbi:MAG: S-layer homology domain-containing protein, partial [Syntrophomonas sp.]|nr:S-layer homology domain-containing protein [Syntrophomonas sp.]
MSKKSLTMLLALLLGLVLCQPAIAAEGFKDINGHWAQVYIEKWGAEDLIVGYPDGQVKPDEPITRSEFVALVNRAFDIEDSDIQSRFSDVNPSDWFYGQVMAGKEEGYIAGYPDGTFKPNHTISRQETAVMITELLNLTAEGQTALQFYTDYLSTDQWAQPGINAVTTHGIMSGFPDNTFRARNNITRAEAVVALDKSLTYQKKSVLVFKGIVELDNQPVKGATVKLFAGDSHEPLKDTVTDENGSFSFAVSNGIYHITALLNKNVGYTSQITVNDDSIPKDLEVVLSPGARVSGTLMDSSGNPLANFPIYFTANPTFDGKSDNNGKFSIVLPMVGNDGQVLTYSGYLFYQGVRQVFASNQQYSGDTDLGQLHTTIPGETYSNGGGAGGNNQPADTTAPIWSQGYPKTADISMNRINLLLQANENGTCYYVIMPDGAVVPGAAEVKMGTGSGGIPAIKSGQVNLQGNNVVSVAIGGLQASTDYEIYVVAEDSMQNFQTDPVNLKITTAAESGDTI